MWETDSPDYNEGRLYDYADWLRSYARDNRDRLDEHGGAATVRTFHCPFCAEIFEKIEARELHVVAEHEGEAA